MRPSRHPACWCQKQPWTKIAAEWRLSTTSGLPGRPATFFLNRNPRRWIYDPTRRSDDVSVLRIWLIMRLRVWGETVSVMASDRWVRGDRTWRAAREPRADPETPSTRGRRANSVSGLCLREDTEAPVVVALEADGQAMLFHRFSPQLCSLHQGPSIPHHRPIRDRWALGVGTRCQGLYWDRCGRCGRMLGVDLSFLGSRDRAASRGSASPLPQR